MFNQLKQTDMNAVTSKMTALEKGYTAEQTAEAVKRVNEIWNAYTKANETIVAPMLKGMPKKATDYFAKFMAQMSAGNLDADQRYVTSILGHMGVAQSDAEIFFVTKIMPTY